MAPRKGVSGAAFESRVLVGARRHHRHRPRARARNLPKVHQRRAVLWGTLGAVVVRVALTGAVVWLLKVPGLMFAGGALLAWIAYRLLTGDDGGREHDVAPAVSFADDRL